MKKILFSIFIFLLLAPFVWAASSFEITKFNHSGSAKNEYVRIKNVSSKEIDMRGWKIKNSTGKTYTFSSVQIKPGQRITLYSRSGKNRLSGNYKKLFWKSKTEIWRNAGDVFYLKNSRGKTVLKYRYGDKKTKSTTSFGNKVFFIHHSTGEIYWNGGMHDALENHGYDADAPWWDGGTDPQDFPTLFSNSNNWNTLNNYNIIIFKSCFPASDITSDSMLNDYKTWYKELYPVYRDHKSKLFVPMSTPPLLQAHTSAAAASRALDFEKWLLGDYKNNYDGNNLAPFGLHSLLSDSFGYLKSDFISSPDDDHPNDYSGQVVGEAIWKHLDAVVK